MLFIYNWNSDVGLYVLAKGTVMLIIINKASTISILSVYSVLGLAKSFVVITLDLSLKPLQKTLFYEGRPYNEVTMCVIKLGRLLIYFLKDLRIGLINYII